MLEIAQKIDWLEIEGATSKLLSRLVGFDTSNPPGYTSEAAGFLYKTLAAEDVFATLVPSEGNKQNLVAQVDGSGKQEPLLLVSPLDVVGADPSGWSEFKPFSGYDDGRYIWGRGTIAAKSLVAAQVMALILVKRYGVALKRHLRFAAYADGFATNGNGLGLITEDHLPLADAEHCLGWGFPPSVALGGKTIFFVHRSERPVLQLTLRTGNWRGHWGGGDAAVILLRGIEALKRECISDFGSDENTKALLVSLRNAAGAGEILTVLADVVKHLESNKGGNPGPGAGGTGDVSDGRGKPGAQLLPQSLIDYISFQFRTNVSVTRITAGSYGGAGARTAEADVVIRPCPGLEINECSARAVGALEGLGQEAPYIARADCIDGNSSTQDAEMDRVILAACRSVSPEAEIVEGINPFPNGLGALRNVGMTTYGFHPLELPDGLDDASRRAFGCDERIPKSALGRMVRIIFETCIRFCA